MTDYDAILLDNDGVLVEPPPRHQQFPATRAAFAAVGIDDPDPAHVDAIVDGVTEAELRAIAAAYDVAPEDLWAAREDHDEQSQFAAFREGSCTTYDDVRALADLPGPLAVVSNNHHSTIAFILDFFGLERHFATYRGRPKTIESLGLKKPHPHAIEATMAELGAETALLVGDAELDVLGAHRAGIDSAFVRREHNTDLVLPEEPTVEVRSLHELAASLS